MKTLKQFLDESSLSRVHKHIKDRAIGIITAHRGEKSKDENEAHSRELKSKIREHGFGYIRVHGHYIENKGTAQEKKVKEHSYIVVGHKHDDKGKLKGFLKKHGEHYNQDSVLYKPHDKEEAHLIGTTKRKDAWLKHGKTASVGKFHANKAGEYHSVIKGHRTFEFHEGADIDLNEVNLLEDIQFVTDAEQTFFRRSEAVEQVF